MSAKKKVLCECPACNATGLYSGFAEAEGEAVICLQCQGTGAVRMTFTPYTGRRRRNKIKTIRLSQGRLLATGVGGVGQGMTYAEFQAKIPAAQPE